MGHTTAAPATGGGDDRTGTLPDEILHHVLSFLPAPEAVRTCVLGRRWTHLWKRTTALRIGGGEREPAPAPPFEATREFVDNFLLLRGGSPLHTFELRVPGAAVDVPRVRLWIRHAVLCRVRVLRLNVVGASPARLPPEDLPLASPELTRIELSGLVFNDSFLDFSRCPSLQHLRIDTCGFMHAKRISSPSLKHLCITNGIFSVNCRTRIHAPSLVSLQLQVFYGRTPVLEDTPCLVLAAVTMGHRCADVGAATGDESLDGWRQDGSSCVLLQGLSQVKNLWLTAAAEMLLFRRDLKWCPTFWQLKILMLNEYWCVPDVQLLACVLEHSPVLEELCLLLFSKEHKYNVEMRGSFHPKELSSTISAHLKRVEVKCELVDDRVLEVLKLLTRFNIYFKEQDLLQLNSK